MPDWLYDAGPNGDWVFLLVTVIMGGMAAYATGGAIASTWRPRWQLVAQTSRQKRLERLPTSRWRSMQDGSISTPPLRGRWQKKKRLSRRA